MGRFSESLQAIDRAIASDGNDRFHVLRARVLLQLDRHQESLEEIERARRAGAKSSELLVPRGLALAGVGRKTEAVAVLRQSLQDAPSSEGAFALLKLQIEDEDWLGAAAVYTTLERIDPDNVAQWKERRGRMHHQEASARNARGDKEGELAQLRLALEASPIQANRSVLVNTLAIKALTLMQAHQYTSARDVVREIHRHDQHEGSKLTRMIEDGEALERKGEELQRRREQPFLPPVAAVGTVQSQVRGSLSGKALDHGNIFELANGQIWQQTEYYIYYYYAYSPSVVIYDDGGISKMKIEGIDHAVTVKRIK